MQNCEICKNNAEIQSMKLYVPYWDSQATDNIIMTLINVRRQDLMIVSIRLMLWRVFLQTSLKIYMKQKMLYLIEHAISL